MDAILDLCDSLENASSEECQQVIDNPQDTNGTSLSQLEVSSLQTSLNSFKAVAADPNLDASATTRLKRLCAHALLSLTSSTELEGNADQRVRFAFITH
jgi:hypothetical protein